MGDPFNLRVLSTAELFQRGVITPEMIEEGIASGAVSREQVERELGQPLEPASETPDEKNAADDQEKPPVPEEKNP